MEFFKSAFAFEEVEEDVVAEVVAEGNVEDPEFLGVLEWFERVVSSALEVVSALEAFDHSMLDFQEDADASFSQFIAGGDVDAFQLSARLSKLHEDLVLDFSAGEHKFLDVDGEVADLVDLLLADPGMVVQVQVTQVLVQLLDQVLLRDDGVRQLLQVPDLLALVTRSVVHLANLPDPA